MKAPVLYIVLLAMLTLTSCVKMAQDVEAPKIESQLVVFSFLSPEEKILKVEVSRSKPVYANQGGTGYINTATVTVTNDGGQSILLPYDDAYNGYVVNQTLYPIEAGRTYTVKVVSGAATVTGSCIVPKDTVSLTEWSSKAVSDPTSNSPGPYFIYNYKWIDQAGVRNYYRLDVERLQKFTMGDTMVYTESLGSSMWDDANRDGGMLSGSTEDYTNSGGSDEYKIFLLNTDIHYFEYHRRRLNYFGDDPFSEPFQQYNNVQGGLGVVGAYRKTSRTVRVQ
ncbi:MAG: DUF4249 family protein [Bacteroidota bacterium]